MVGSQWDGDDDGWGLLVQGVEAAPSSLVRISYGDDQNDGWRAAPISGQTYAQDRKRSVRGVREPIQARQPTKCLTAGSDSVAVPIGKEEKSAALLDCVD